MTSQPTYSIIIPVFNEEANLPELHRRLMAVLGQLQEPYEIVFVNDGSTDNSVDILRQLAAADPGVKVLVLSRNFGHQMAITAGMDYASGAAAVVMDADLQDPPEVIPQFVQKWKEGCQVVYGVRQKREGETWFKLFTASLFYRLIRKIARIDIPADVGDFRLVDRKVLDSLKNVKERNRFVRGLVSWVGYKQTGVLYQREKRLSGETKYPLTKMIRFAFDAITSFSFFPLRLATYLGFFVSFLCLLYILYVFALRLFTSKAIPGWSSLMVAILFVGGVQLITIGLMGEYLGRIGEEVKNRPLYIVGEVIGRPQASEVGRA